MSCLKIYNLYIHQVFFFIYLLISFHHNNCKHWNICCTFFTRHTWHNTLHHMHNITTSPIHAFQLMYGLRKCTWCFQEITWHSYVTVDLQFKFQSSLNFWLKTDIWLNWLWTSDTIWQHRSGSALAQVIGCSLTAPIHYLNQSSYLISRIKSKFLTLVWNLGLTHWPLGDLTTVPN